MKFHVITLFPNAIAPYLDSSIIGRARLSGHISVELIQLRNFAKDKHKTVDSSPYGGGEGMVLKADVLYDAWNSITQGNREAFKTIFLSPQGRLWTQKLARAQYKAWEERPFQWVLVCGHYEGIDERFIDECVDEEWSIGEFILTGGELPALVCIETLARLVPQVVQKETSVSLDSFEVQDEASGESLLKYPQYTKPRHFKGREVPEVLLSGNHQKINEWRMSQRKERTKLKKNR